MSSEYKTYKLGDFKLQSGEIIPDAFIAYKTFGEPTSPAIIHPTWFSGLISDNVWLIGEDKTLNPKKYFIIILALIGNGESISPSNSNIKPFPKVTFHDNVRAQHELVTKELGIKHARAVIGWSMGAGQAYQWATQFPEFVDLCIPHCGSAKTSIHNIVFLEGVKSAILAGRQDSSFGPAGEDREKSNFVQGTDGKWTQQQKEAGLKAMGRVYAGWGFSQAWYREHLYEKAFPFKSLEDYLIHFWEGLGLSKDPENLLVMLYTWQAGDVSAQEPYNGDFAKAMKGIKAQTLVVPGQTDLYFPPEDSEIEVNHMSSGVGKRVVIPSIWGHWAGGPGGNPDDIKFLDDKLAKFFEKGTVDAITERLREL